MFKYVIVLLLILGFIGVFFIEKDDSISPVIHKTEEKIQLSSPVKKIKKRQVLKSIDSKKNDKLLEKAMNTNVIEPDATYIWEWLVKNGFEHPDSMKQLQNLFLVNGVRKYYKELIIALNEENLSDNVRAYLIEIVTSSFDGKRLGNEASLYTPENEKDREIQKLILDELNYPKGSKSFISALESTYFIGDDNQVQELLNGLLNQESKFIDKNEIYKQKIRVASLSNKSDNLLPILEKINTLNIKDKKVVLEEIIAGDFAYAVKRNDNQVLKEEYVKFLEENPPSQLQSFDDKSFNIELEKNFKFPENIVTDESKQEYFQKEVTRLYEEKKVEEFSTHSKYTNWIYSYGTVLDKKERYNFYEKTLLKANNEEKEAILYKLQEESMSDKEYLELFHQLEKNKNIST